MLFILCMALMLFTLCVALKGTLSGSTFSTQQPLNTWWSEWMIWLIYSFYWTFPVNHFWKLHFRKGHCRHNTSAEVLVNLKNACHPLASIKLTLMGGLWSVSYSFKRKHQAFMRTFTTVFPFQLLRILTPVKSNPSDKFASTTQRTVWTI